MSVIDAERIAKTYEPFDIFWDVSCSVAWGDRIALVGRNGTGKTTLLQHPGRAGRAQPAARCTAPGGSASATCPRGPCWRARLAPSQDSGYNLVAGDDDGL